MKGQLKLRAPKGVSLKLQIHTSGLKKIVVFISLLLSVPLSGQTIYYSKSSGNLNLVGTWGINPNGSGTSPANFSTPGVTYVIANTSSATISAPWTVSGLGALVQVGDGINPVEFIIPSNQAFNGPVAVANSGTLTNSNTTNPTISSLAAGSTVRYAGAGNQTVVNANYFNLIIAGSGQKALANSLSTSITNSLIISAGALLRLNTVNTLTTTISGSISGPGRIVGSANANLVLNGSGDAGVLSFSLIPSLNHLRVARAGAGIVSLTSDLVVESSFIHEDGIVNLTTHSLTLNGAVKFPGSSTNGFFRGSPNASLSIGGTGTFTNVLLFDQSNNIARSLSAFTFNRPGQSLILGGNLEVRDQYTHTAGNILLNDQELTINGAISFPSVANSGLITGSPSSSLVISGSGAITNSLRFNLAVPNGQSLGSFIYNRSGTVLNLGTSLNCNSQFTHLSGTLSIASAQLTLNGNITFPPNSISGQLRGSTTSSLVISGSGSISNLLCMSQNATSARTLNYFSLSRPGETLMLGNPLRVTNFFHNNGLLAINGSSLTLTGNATFPGNPANGAFVGSPTSSLSITNNSGVLSNAMCFSTASLNDHSLSRFALNISGQLQLGSDLDVLNNYAHTSGFVSLNANALTMSGNITFPNAAPQGNLIGSPNATLNINGSGTITNALRLDPAGTSGLSLHTFRLNRNAANLILATGMICVANFSHVTGQISIASSSLVLNGSITFPQSAANGQLTSTGITSLIIGGSGSIVNALQMDQNSVAARTLNRFQMNRPSETLALGNALIANTYSHVAGTVGLNGNLLTLNGPLIFPVNASAGVLAGSLSSSLTIAGTGAITNSLCMDQSTANSRSLYDLVLNRAGQNLLFGNSIEIRNQIRPTAGSIVTSGLVTLKADGQRSAMIAPVTGSITGTINVETHAPGGATGWTHLGPTGVNGLTVADWESQFPVTCYGCPFDENSAGGFFVSIQSFNEALAGNAAYALLSYTSALANGTGYWVYLGNGFNNTSSITYSVAGPVVSGDVVKPLSFSANSGQHLLANPYAAPIDWDLVSADAANANVSGAIVFYNPDLGQTVTYAGGISNPSGYITNGIIPAGQGFYVQALTSTSITFRESHKSTANTNVNPLLRNTTSEHPGTVFRLSVLGEQLDYDETVIRFHADATTGFDRALDAAKLFSQPDLPSTSKAKGRQTSICTQSEKNYLAINSLPAMHGGNYKIPVLVKVSRTGNYVVSPIDLDNFPESACIQLKDNFLNVTHDLRKGPYQCVIYDSTSVPRFELEICHSESSTTGFANGPRHKNSVIVYPKESTFVAVKTHFEKSQRSQVSAYTITGQEIFSDRELNSSEEELVLDFAAYRGQIVLIKVSNSQGHIVKKINIPG